MNTDQFAHWAQHILEYALDNYDDDGWDYIYECWTLDDIASHIQCCVDYESALSSMHCTALAYDEARSEARDA